jgi:hypothetical protein
MEFIMFNTYNNIAHQVFINNPGKIYLSENEDLLQQFENDPNFLKVLSSLHATYQVTYNLVGYENFKILTVKYMQLNPAHTINGIHYGKSFPEFLMNIKELENLGYIGYIAKLDWYWIQETTESDELLLPQGTLSAWSSLLKDSSDINIELDMNEVERIKIQKNGTETSIVTV